MKNALHSMTDGQRIEMGTTWHSEIRDFRLSTSSVTDDCDTLAKIKIDSIGLPFLTPKIYQSVGATGLFRSS